VEPTGNGVKLVADAVWVQPNRTESTSIISDELSAASGITKIVECTTSDAKAVNSIEDMLKSSNAKENSGDDLFIAPYPKPEPELDPSPGQPLLNPKITPLMSTTQRTQTDLPRLGPSPMPLS
jgi:hypothetical protein